MSELAIRQGIVICHNRSIRVADVTNTLSTGAVHTYLALDNTVQAAVPDSRSITQPH